MTNNQANPFLYNITPINVLESRLKFSDKIILSDIITVFNENMPYYKSNKFLAKKFKASANTISNVFSRLIKDDWIKTRINKLDFREVTAINVKKIFGGTVTKNLKSSFMDYKRFAKWIRISFSNMKDKLAKGNLPSQKLGGVYSNNYKQPSQKLGEASQNLGEPSQKMLTSNISSNIKSKNISNKKLHVRSSKSKSKNSNEPHDDSLASNKVQSKAGLTMINSKKAGAQAHLARRNSSKHSSRFSNSTYIYIDSQILGAFPNLYALANKSFEKKCISSWLYGSKKFGTPKFSIDEIISAIRKAGIYKKQNEVSDPLALIFNILQTSRKEVQGSKASKQKYSKASNSSASKSKSSSASSSSSVADPVESAQIKQLGF